MGNVRKRIFLLTFLLGCGYSGAFAEPLQTILSGSFVQPDLAGSWRPNQWRQELQYMREVRMNTLILQWTVDSGQHTTTYPTLMPGYTNNTQHDIVESALESADHLSVGVWCGLNVNSGWWTNSVHNRDWFLGEMQTGSAIISELWSRYGHHRSLAGWYIALEPWNESLDSNALTNMIDGLNLVVKCAHQLTGLPVAIAPFYNTTLGQNADQYGSTWGTILGAVPLDVVALQDGIGAGHATIDQLPIWFNAMRQAITSSGSSAHLRADTETFTSNQTMPVIKMISDILVIQSFVDGYWSFSFNHYLSPQQVTPVYYRQYRSWVTTSIKLEESK